MSKFPCLIIATLLLSILMTSVKAQDFNSDRENEAKVISSAGCKELVSRDGKALKIKAGPSMEEIINFDDTMEIGVEPERTDLAATYTLVACEPKLGYLLVAVERDEAEDIALVNLNKANFFFLSGMPHLNTQKDSMVVVEPIPSGGVISDRGIQIIRHSDKKGWFSEYEYRPSDATSWSFQEWTDNHHFVVKMKDRDSLLSWNSTFETNSADFKRVDGERISFTPHAPEDD